jgi:hypothetical protein
MDATNMSTNMSATMDYQDFIAAKVAAAPEMGFSAPLPLHDSLFPHQRAIVDWAITRGRAAIFAAFGLGKTRMQIELARQTCAHTGGRFLIVAPLGVRGSSTARAWMRLPASAASAAPRPSGSSWRSSPVTTGAT